MLTTLNIGVSNLATPTTDHLIAANCIGIVLCTALKHYCVIVNIAVI